MQQGVGPPTPPDGHDEGIWDELRGHFGLHRPADHAPREQINDGCNIEPALGGPHIGEVGGPLLVRSISMKRAIQNVRCGNRQALPLILRQSLPPRPCPQGLSLHQTFDAMQVAVQPLVSRRAGCNGLLERSWMGRHH